MSVDAAWKDVHSEAARLKPVHLRDLFAHDAGRFTNHTVSLNDLLIDYSKEKIDSGAFDALIRLARANDVEGKRDAMFSGETWNLTEGRAVLHMALRDGAKPPVGDNVSEVRDSFLKYAETVRTGGLFDDVVNIGIGGSDLGPVMATRALAPDHDGPRVHFVSNVDGAHLTDVLRGLDPKRTLVIVASKTFTTLETMTNARSARDWLGEHAATNMTAVTTNLPACADFSSPKDRVFGFWEWVGGRYSLWSAIGLPLAIAVGEYTFREFLVGAASMDRHFRDAPLEQNLPVVLALIGIWRRNAMGWPTVALIPYDQRLERFPAYVQQLDMESNGKRVTRGGSAVSQSTGAVIWGEAGTNAQHSFFQLIHQGTDVIPVDFIVAAKPRERLGDHHALLLTNCLAQAQALAFGKTEEDVCRDMAAEGKNQAEIDRLAFHRTFPGDRPSTTILHRELNAYALGRLIALYEHKVFVQGVIWDVNSFDQYGVELGKQLASELAPVVRAERDGDGLDSSTAGLIAKIHELGA
jgi:glucose-6-phosphate isomerase